MTREIRKRVLAESDLLGIWEYTFREWDAAQADKYLDELDDAGRTAEAHSHKIESILEHVAPELGRR